MPSNEMGTHGDVALGFSPAEWEWAYREYHGNLVRFVRRCASDRGLSEAQLDAEGVVQETFELARRHWTRIDNPPAWLFTVARRLVGKSQVAATAVDLATLHDRTPRWSSLVPRASVEDAVTARAVVEAIDRLPDRQRTATYLRHVEGWSLSEIADLLACAPSTTGVHVHRGVTKLLGWLAAIMGLAAASAAAKAVWKSAHQTPPSPQAPPAWAIPTGFSWLIIAVLTSIVALLLAVAWWKRKRRLRVAGGWAESEEHRNRKQR